MHAALLTNRILAPAPAARYYSTTELALVLEDEDEDVVSASEYCTVSSLSQSQQPLDGVA